MKHVFVSSTFKDMQFERDALHKKCAHNLDARLSEYGEGVYFGDLRWGVNTTALDSDEGSRRVLKVCLDEIDDCRPYMIVLIGERYGWIPDVSLIRDAAAEKGVSVDTEMSVTQLEIEYGALLAEGCEGRVFFYFRELDTSEMSEELRRDYAAESELHRVHVEALKARICAQYPDAVRTYTAKYDAATDSIVGLEGFLESVERDLGAAFLADLKEEENLPWQERAMLSAARHYLELAENYHPAHREPVTLFDGVFAKEDTKMRFIKGSSGTGKSAFLAHSYAEAVENGEGDTLLPFVLGLDKYSTTEMDYFKILLYMIEKRSGMREHYETTYGDPAFDNQIFREIFSIVGLVEGTLKSFVDNCSFQLQNWLSTKVLDRHFPACDVEYFGGDECSCPHLNFTVAYSADEEAVMLPPWFDYSRTYVLDEVSEEDQVPLINMLLKQKHKELDTSVIERVAGKEQARSPFYLKLTVDRLLMLEHDDFAAIRKMGDGMDNINRYQISLVDTLPETAEGMAAELITKVASSTNEELVMRVIGLLVYGAIRMTDTDIMAVFDTQGWTYSSLDFALATRSLSSVINYNPKDKSYAVTNPAVINAAEALLAEQGYSYVARSLFDHIVSVHGGPLADALFRAASYVGSDFLSEFYIKQYRNKMALASETDWLIKRHGVELVSEILTRVATNRPDLDFSFILEGIPTACLTMDDSDAYSTLLQTILDNFRPTSPDGDRVNLNTLGVIAFVKLISMRMTVNTSVAAPLFDELIGEGIREVPMTPRARLILDSLFYRFEAKRAFYTMGILEAESEDPVAVDLIEKLESLEDQVLLGAHLFGAFAAYLDRAYEPTAGKFRALAKRSYELIGESIENDSVERITADDIALMIDAMLDEKDEYLRTKPTNFAAAIDFMSLGQTKVNSRLLKYLPRILAAAKYTFDDDESDFSGQTVLLLRRLCATSRAVAGAALTADDFLFATTQMEYSYDILADELSPDDHVELIRHFDRFTNITLSNSDGNPVILYRTFMAVRHLLTIFDIYDFTDAKRSMLSRVTSLEFTDEEMPLLPELFIGTLVYRFGCPENEELRLHLVELLEAVQSEPEYMAASNTYTPELMYIGVDLRSEDEIEADEDYFGVDDSDDDFDDGEWADPDDPGDIDLDGPEVGSEEDLARMMAMLEEMGLSLDDLFPDDDDGEN